MGTRILRLLSAILLALPALARADIIPPGLYRAAQGPELAAELEIRADGRFAYGLAYGALDERAEGLWAATEKGLALSTQPKPKPPEFRLDPVGPEGGAPLSLLVRWPDGRGIAGVDFRIGFTDGSEMEGYTQEYGWSLGDPARSAPVWVVFTEPMHRFSSPRIPITAGVHDIRVTLVPNDLGVADFERIGFEALGEGSYLLHHPMGDIRFRAVSP